MTPVTVTLWLAGACALAALVAWAIGTQLADDRLAYLEDDEVPS